MTSSFRDLSPRQRRQLLRWKAESKVTVKRHQRNALGVRRGSKENLAFPLAPGSSVLCEERQLEFLFLF